MTTVRNGLPHGLPFNPPPEVRRPIAGEDVRALHQALGIDLDAFFEGKSLVDVLMSPSPITLSRPRIQAALDLMLSNSYVYGRVADLPADYAGALFEEVFSQWIACMKEDLDPDGKDLQAGIAKQWPDLLGGTTP